MRSWWSVVAGLSIGLACGILWLANTPKIYEASARIYVDTQSILKPLMAGLTVQPNVEQQVSMLSRTLISRPNVEKLIKAVVSRDAVEPTDDIVVE